jgi:hypothetical protein
MPSGPLTRRELIAALVAVLAVLILVGMAMDSFRGPFAPSNIVVTSGHRVPSCDPDLDSSCPIPSYRDSIGVEPPGQDPVFSYPPGPRASAP